MRQTISGLVAAVAVMTAGAAPALACGFTSCSPCAQGYASPCAQSYVPTVVGTGCNSCGGGWGYERLAEPATQYYPERYAEPTTQYYYVNQGPTYSGPGMFAPYPAYRENAVSGWGEDERAPYHYGYHGGYGYRHHGYGYAPRHYGYHHAYRYGYFHHRYGYGYPLRRYY
jgi:hypothetical protein